MLDTSSHHRVNSELLPRLKELFWEAIDEDYRVATDFDHMGVDTELASLPLDSLASIQLMYGIEAAFGVHISEEAAAEFETVGDVIHHIETKPEGNQVATGEPTAEQLPGRQ